MSPEFILKWKNVTIHLFYSTFRLVTYMLPPTYNLFQKKIRLSRTKTPGARYPGLNKNKFIRRNHTHYKDLWKSLPYFNQKVINNIEFYA